jgi:hypothetical protein
MNFRVPYNAGYFRLADDLSPSQVGMCSMVPVGFLLDRSFARSLVRLFFHSFVLYYVRSLARPSARSFVSY